MFTREGHDDFFKRINRGNLYYDGEGLSFFQKRRESNKEDPLTTTINDIIEESEKEEEEENEYDGKNEEASTESQEDDSIFNALVLATQGRVSIPQENRGPSLIDHVRDQGVSEEDEMKEISDANFISYIDSARKTLKRILHNNFSMSKVSADNVIKYFNTYLTTEDQFHDYQTDDFIGYQWKLIKIDFPNYGPIARLALILCNSGISEASCERTISTQRLICNARRRHSNKRTLDARLRIMRSGLREPI